MKKLGICGSFFQYNPWKKAMDVVWWPLDGAGRHTGTSWALQNLKEFQFLRNNPKKIPAVVENKDCSQMETGAGVGHGLIKGK